VCSQRYIAYYTLFSRYQSHTQVAAAAAAAADAKYATMMMMTTTMVLYSIDE